MNSRIRQTECNWCGCSPAYDSDSLFFLLKKAGAGGDQLGKSVEPGDVGLQVGRLLTRPQPRLHSLRLQLCQDGGPV
jgi:hypothetical protein